MAKSRVKNNQKWIIITIIALAILAPFVAKFVSDNNLTTLNFAAKPSNPSANILLATPEPVGFGDVVNFSVVYPPMLKNPRIWLSCYQNDVMVYGEGGGPTTNFKLGGDSSRWVENGGGPASCTVELYEILGANGKEWNGHGAQSGRVSLATTTFEAVE
jgi:hypothetical protein